MNETPLPISTYPAPLPRTSLKRMLRTVRALYKLSTSTKYRDDISDQLHETARFDPGHASLMMGYDFHLAGEQPQLIEVNTNAGGSFLALQAEPNTVFRRRINQRTLETFNEDFARFTGNNGDTPRYLVILDEHPEGQFLFPEMTAFARQLQERGTTAAIADPEELQADNRGVFHNGNRVDMIYNRHCDFYLESPEMEGVKDAYLAGNVCLSPNPFSYGLLADKRRLPLWRSRDSLKLWGLSAREVDLLQATLPECAMLADLDRERVWVERKGWVFKPATQFGSRGVLLGEKTTRKRFDTLDAATTLCQRQVQPQMLTYPDGKTFKCDLRLFVYRNRLLGLAARLYRGQVTNMRTEGGGFARVELI